MLKKSGRFLAVGLEMGIAVFIGMWVGRYLDSSFGTEPVLSLVGLLLGILAAGKAVYDAAKLARREMIEGGESEADEED